MLSTDIAYAANEVIQKQTLKLSPVLMRVSSIFPFNLFPDSLTIRATEIDVVCRPEIGERWIHRVLIENITNVSVTTFIFIAHLEITDSTNPRNVILINVRNLSVKDAYAAEACIEGLIKLMKENLKLADMDKQTLIAELAKHNSLIKETADTKKEVKLPHYYGDIIRGLYILSGVIMLSVLPFFQEIIPVHYSISIVGLLAMVLISGLTNPRSFMIILFDNFISLAGFIVFEIMAVTFYKEDKFFSIVNQILALNFFLGIYFSMKTLRGFFSHYDNSG